MNTENELGKRIKLAREMKGLRQEDVAQALGVSINSVQGWESGRAAPRGSLRIIKLSSLLGIDPGQLVANDLPEGYLNAYRTKLSVLSKEIEANGEVNQNALLGPRASTGVMRPGMSANLQEYMRKRDQVYDRLRAALPTELRSNLNGSVDLKGRPYEFSYLSKNVLVVLLGPVTNPERIMQTSLRSAMYKALVGMKILGDDHLPSRHYLVAAIGSEETILPLLPSSIIPECNLFCIDAKAFKTTKDLADHIVELESTQTPLDEAHESAMGVDESNFDEF